MNTSRLLAWVIPILTFLFFLPTQVSAETIDAPATIPSASTIIVNFSGMKTGDCYVWRLYNNDNQSYEHAKTNSATRPCDTNGYSAKPDNFFSTKELPEKGQVSFDPVAAGNYTVSLHRYSSIGGGPLSRVSVDKLDEDTFVVEESGVTNTPTPAPLPTKVPYDCSNRPPSCSTSNYPKCQESGTETSPLICGDNAYSCGFNGGGKHFCAFPATVTPPPANTNNSCQFNGTAQELLDPEFTPPSCAAGWKSFHPIPNSASSCICIPENAPEPTRAGEVFCEVKCPDSNYPIYDELMQSCKAVDSADSISVCVKAGGTTPPPPPKPPCPSDKVVRGPNKEFAGCEELYTGLGFTISTNPADFISDLFTFLLSISGGILLILIVMAGYQMMTSQGNPDKIKEAKERIVSAVIGFVFLVFSLVILEVIGVNILRIPGFGETGTGLDETYTQTENARRDRGIPSPTPSPKVREIPRPPRVNRAPTSTPVFIGPPIPEDLQ